MLSRRILRWSLAGTAAGAGVGIAVTSGEIIPTLLVGAAYALGHLVPLHSRAGRLQPLSPAVAAGAVFTTPFVAALAGALIGLPLGWLLARARFGERAADDVLPGEAAGLAAFGAVLAGLHAVFPQAAGSWVHLGMLLPAGGAWHVASSGARTGWTEMRQRFAAGQLWRTALADWSADVVLVTAGALYGLTRDAMGWWAILLAAMPYAFTHFSLTRLSTAAATYRQTIHALGRVPEAAGFTTSGHAERTADLAVALAGELGLSPAETRRVEQAALLAEIGRVVLGGPTLDADPGHAAAEVAARSAVIVAEAPSMQRVAAIVARTHCPYRRPGEERDPTLPAGAQVVKVASAYDWAVGAGREAVDALEALHAGLTYDYDPEVVAALRRVLVRRGSRGV